LKIQCESSGKLFCDNKLAINIAYNPVQYNRTIHIEIDWHFIKEKYDSGLITSVYIPFGHQVTYVSTNGLSTESLVNLLTS